MQNIIKRKSTYYADFRNHQGTRIRKSLGKDKAQAKIRLLQIMADCTFTAGTQSVSPKSNKGKSFEFAVNEFIKDEYKIQNAWTKQKFDQYGERQALFVTNTIRDFSVSAKIKNVNQAKYSHMKSFLGDRALEVKATSINRYMQILKRFFQYCEDMDFIEKNYACKLRI